MKKLLTRAVFPLILVLAVGFLGFVRRSNCGTYPAPSIHGAGGYDPNGGYSNDVVPGHYLVLYADNNSFAGSPNDVVLIDGSVASIVGDITSQINIFIGNLSGGDHSVKVITPGGQDSTGFTVRSATPSVVNGSCGTAFNSSFSSAPQPDFVMSVQPVRFPVARVAACGRGLARALMGAAVPLLVRRALLAPTVPAAHPTAAPSVPLRNPDFVMSVRPVRSPVAGLGPGPAPAPMAPVAAHPVRRP